MPECKSPHRFSSILFALFVPSAAALSFLLSSFAVFAAPIALSECRLESAASTNSTKARCGWYQIPENRDQPEKLIRLQVAVIPALRKTPQPDPLFILSGGPGQAASDFYLSSLHAFEWIRRDRDLVIVDQRGTGHSNQLDCELPDELESTQFDTSSIKHYTSECLKMLSGDPRFYSTSVAVRDLEEIRAALGYATINLYGISYGTRVAQHYLRRYPERVRAVVLDGIVPVENALGADVAINAQSALDTIFARCAKDAQCSKAFGNSQSQFVELQSRLERASWPLVIADPRTAEATTLQFGYLHLVAAVRLLSYSDDTATLIPYLIHQAAQGRPNALAAQALSVSRTLNKQVANGMHNAVVCTEDIPFLTPQALTDPSIERSYLKRYFLESLQAMCSVWPRGAIDSDFHAPLKSNKPALLLSGENDPVTPARYGSEAAKSFDHGVHVIVPGKGHGQFSNPCVARIMRDFLATASAVSLDTQCVTQQGAAPFMLNASSPGP